MEHQQTFEMRSGPMISRACGTHAGDQPLEIISRAPGAYGVQSDITGCVLVSGMHASGFGIGGLVGKRRSIAGSMIDGITENQKMRDVCAERGMVVDIALIRAVEINDAYERMLNGDVKYRFIIDSSSLEGGK